MNLPIKAQGRNTSNFLNITLKDFCFVSILILLMMQVAIEEVFPSIGYLDELVALGLGVCAVAKFSCAREKHLNVNDKRLLLLLLIMIGLGLLGSAFSGIKTSLFAIGVDVVTCSKFIITLCACYILASDSRKIIQVLEVLSKFLCAVLFVLAVANIAFDFGMGGQVRYGIRSFNFIFYHPVVVVWFTAGLIAVLLSNPKKNKVFIYMGLLVVCMSLRAKGICWAFGVFFLMSTIGKNGRIGILHIIVVAAGIGMLAADSIEMYYFDNTIETARSALTKTSFMIANEYFPLGTGFASFGSSITATPEFYSPLYYVYGLSNIWGIGLAHPNYISDSFWPTVVAQFGWGGLLLMIAIIYCIVRGILERLSGSISKYWLAPISLVMYLILGSAGESAFFNPQSVYFAIIIALLCLNSRRNEEKEGIIL
ncbi:MAG: hypothetical protein RR547_03170 [Raoultibacter sp.]